MKPWIFPESDWSRSHEPRTAVSHDYCDIFDDNTATRYIACICICNLFGFWVTTLNFPPIRSITEWQFRQTLWQYDWFWKKHLKSLAFGFVLLVWLLFLKIFFNIDKTDRTIIHNILKDDFFNEIVLHYSYESRWIRGLSDKLILAVVSVSHCYFHEVIMNCLKIIPIALPLSLLLSKLVYSVPY